MKIPKISDERLEELVKRIKPVVKHRGKVLCYIKACDPRTIAFSWSPKFLSPAQGLKLITSIQTLHTFAYYGFFKPTIAEVLAQIPVELIDTVTAFEVVGPQTAADLNREQKALHAGFHVATTNLYSS